MHNTFRLLNYSPRDCIQDTDDKIEQRQSTILDIERLELLITPYGCIIIKLKRYKIQPPRPKDKKNVY